MKKKDREHATIIDEPYICTSCGRENLTFDEIAFALDSDNQIIEESVQCQPCLFKSPKFQKILRKDSEAARKLDEMIDEKDRNYDERMLKRVLKQKEEKKEG